MKPEHGVYRHLFLLLALFLLVLNTSCRLGQGVSPTAAPATAAAEISDLGPGIPDVNGEILFQDDFQDGQPDGWTINGAWYIQQADDLYYFTASSLGGAWVTAGTSWSGYLYHAGVRLESGSLFLSTNMTQAGRYLLLLRADGMYLLREQPEDNFVSLAETGPITTGIGHSVSIANQSGHLQVYIDQVLWMDYTDPEPITVGTVGVAVQDNSSVAVDNILVMQLNTPLPSGVVQAPPVAASAPEPEEIIPESGGGLAISEIGSESEPENENEPGPAGLADIQISNISMLPDPLSQNQPMTVAVTVLNAGNADAGAFNVRWYPEGANFVGCSWDVPSLAAGEGVDLSCGYQGYPNSGTFNWGVSADADDEIAESDEGNNDRSGDLVVEPAAIVEPGDLPPAPTDCAVLLTGATEISLGWGWPYDNALTDGFRIYQGTTSLEASTPDGTWRSWNIPNLDPGTQYHFDVRAFNAAGESPVDACAVDATTSP